MSDTFAIASDLRILDDDELHVVAGGDIKEHDAGRYNVVPVRVCVRECTVIRYRDGSTEQKCQPPKCGPPPKS